MKKVGILNFQYSNRNYGAVLQAAALEHILRQLGHDSRHIDFMTHPKISVKGRVGQLLRILGLRKIGQLLRILGLRKKNRTQQIGNEEAFERFRCHFLNRTKRIVSAKGFADIAKEFDVVVVGSDQVWRPAFAKDPIAFFLGYVPNGTARVAYAASFGTSIWEQSGDIALTAKVKEELSKFKAISCREESGVDICRNVFDVEATHVLDPLLLVDDSFFEQIISKSSVKSRSKLVYYKLDFNQDFHDDLKKIGDTLGSDAVNIYLKNSHTRGYQDVPDWLSLIRNSEVVITDSFHCICLALRFGKEVLFCQNEKRGQTRLDSLFKKLLVNVTPLDLELKTPIFSLSNRSDVGAILEVERTNSLKFISDALDG